jgi:hypothetical protein
VATLGLRGQGEAAADVRVEVVAHEVQVGGSCRVLDDEVRDAPGRVAHVGAAQRTVDATERVGPPPLLAQQEPGDLEPAHREHVRRAVQPHGGA